MKNALLIAALALAGCGGSGSPAARAIPPATEHLLSYGQSLSLGNRSVVDFPTNETIPSADNENVGLMFSGGTRPEDLSSLVPFDESMTPVPLADWGIDVPGETPLYGALLTIKTLDNALHVASAAGKGGTDIADLSKGSEPYARLLAQVTAAKALSPGAYSVLGVIWMQGESDPNNFNYGAQFAQLVMDIDSDIRAVTHQGSIQFYVCTTDLPEIAAQQKAVAAANPNVHIACDDNDFAKSDGTHLTAASSKAVGVALGNAIMGVK